jgi:hypothetical protein
MNTDRANKNYPEAEKSDGNPIAKVVNHLQRVETKGAEAKANKTSMRDGQGRRIEFNEGKNQPSKVIRGISKPRNTIQGGKG